MIIFPLENVLKRKNDRAQYWGARGEEWVRIFSFPLTLPLEPSLETWRTLEKDRAEWGRGGSWPTVLLPVQKWEKKRQIPVLIRSLRYDLFFPKDVEVLEAWRSCVRLLGKESTTPGICRSSCCRVMSKRRYLSWTTIALRTHVLSCFHLRIHVFD